ncbi:MAG TPA: tetratricopeptide repeat protein [Terracidiphilus sp.]|nr:tetratricopeptide repeat protein [Terracidiphilus sp.]
MLRPPILLLAGAALFLQPAGAQFPAQHTPLPGASASSPPQDSQQHGATDAQAELEAGSALTRQGFFEQAIPHLLAARRQGMALYATGVNLAICYLGTHQYKEAVSDLRELAAGANANATVYNLLAQAYLGSGQKPEAWKSFLLAAQATPKDESLYDYLADACTDQGDYSMGLGVVNEGLKELPDSARLHYERAVFLARLGSLDRARPEFEQAVHLAPGSDIGYLAEVQQTLYDDQYAKAEQVLRKAIAAGHDDFRMQSLLGTVLLHEGAAPGDPKFAEAKAALAKAAEEHPNDSTTEIALGKVYLMEGQAREAIKHLEVARRLDPNNVAVYASLASAWGKLGERQKAAEMRRQMSRLVARQAANSSPAKP